MYVEHDALTSCCAGDETVASPVQADDCSVNQASSCSKRTPGVY